MIQTKPKSKRGRKSKPDWQRLRNEIKLHLDDGNYAVVKDMARESGLSLRACLKTNVNEKMSISRMLRHLSFVDCLNK